MHHMYLCQYFCRYDRFIDAFEHVANMIDDIYKVCIYLGYDYMNYCMAGNFDMECNLTV